MEVYKDDKNYEVMKIIQVFHKVTSLLNLSPLQKIDDLIYKGASSISHFSQPPTPLILEANIFTLPLFKGGRGFELW